MLRYKIHKTYELKGKECGVYYPLSTFMMLIATISSLSAPTYANPETNHSFSIPVQVDSSLLLAQNNLPADTNIPAQDGANKNILIEGENKPSIDIRFLNEKYNYDPKNKKDPFRPYQAPRAVFNAETPIGPVLPLQKFNVEDLKVKGIIWGVENPTAMIIAPDNEVYYVREREKVGNNNGYIAQIRDGEIVIVESFMFGGEITSQVKILPLDQSLEGSK